jgi:hypothetical protein
MHVSEQQRSPDPHAMPHPPQCDVLVTGTQFESQHRCCALHTFSPALASSQSAFAAIAGLRLV